MKQQNRHILLFPDILVLKCLSFVLLFSSNTTSVSQPLDQGIITCTNMNCRELMRSLIPSVKSASFATELAKPYHSLMHNLCSRGDRETVSTNNAEVFTERSIFYWWSEWWIGYYQLYLTLDTHPTSISECLRNIDLPQAHHTKWKHQHCINKTQGS
jgi:hypothetical protein